MLKKTNSGPKSVTNLINDLFTPHINRLRKQLYFFYWFFLTNTHTDNVSIQKAKFSIGDVVKHRHFDFRGVIYDVDFEFNNSEEWYQSIPKNVRPRKDQPFYHLLAENDEITYEAYVSEQNLLLDDSGEPIKHPLINEIFSGKKGSSYFKPSNWILVNF